MIQRSAFVLRVRPDKIDDYIEAHRAALSNLLSVSEAAVFVLPRTYLLIPIVRPVIK